MSSTSYALAIRNKNHYQMIILNCTNKSKNFKKKNEKKKINFKSFKIKKINY